MGKRRIRRGCILFVHLKNSIKCIQSRETEVKSANIRTVQGISASASPPPPPQHTV